MEIAEFLLVRIAEDEQTSPNIHAAGCWSTHWEHDRLGYDVKDCNCDIPTCIRAECAAKRAIIAKYERACHQADHDDADFQDIWEEISSTLEQVLMLHTQPYADHPDFNPAWRI